MASILFPFEPNWARPHPSGQRSWEVAIQHAEDGGEKRRLLGQRPVNTLRLHLTTRDGQESAMLRLWLKEYADKQVDIPFWPHFTELTANVAIGAGTLPVVALTGQDFDVAQVIVYQDHLNYELLTLAAQPATGAVTIDHTGTTAQAWPAGTRVYPVRTGQLRQLPATPPLTGCNVDTSFEWTEEPPGTAAAFTPPVPTLFENRPILEFHPDAPGQSQGWEMLTEFHREGLGQSTPWNMGETFQKWTYRFTLKGQAQIRSFFDFYDHVKGTEQGFWIPTWQGDLKFTNTIDAANKYLLIAPIGLATVLSSSTYVDALGNPYVDAAGNPYVFIDLQVVDKESLKRLALIQGSAVNAQNIAGFNVQGAQERINLTALNGGGPFTAPGTFASWLLFVRFAGPLKITWLAAESAQIEIRVIELPKEYAAAETGADPVWLYDLLEGATVIRRSTSFARNLSAGGNTYTAEDMSHGDITRSGDLIDEGPEVAINTADLNHPLNGYYDGLPPEKRMTLIIYQTTATAPDLANLLAKGKIRDIGYPGGPRIEVKLSGLGAIGQRPAVNRTIGKRCGVGLFGIPCSLIAANFKTTGSVDVITASPAPYIEMTEILTDSQTQQTAGKVASADDWFPLGRVVIGNEQRGIIKQSGVRVYLNAPFKTAAVNDTANVFPGCNHTSLVCETKFDNLVNHRGLPWFPDLNPSLEAMQAQQPQLSTGKK